MIVTIDGLPVYRAEIDGEDEGMYCISLVDYPAVLRDFQKLSKQERQAPRRLMYAISDEEKRLVRGVVMRADFPIYRNDMGAGYYIIYKADTIRRMAEKYLADNRQNAVNLDHQEGAYVEGVQMVQYFIKDTAAGISPEGFEDCADGSLFAEFHISDDAIWEQVKAGTYRGFSLEGYFTLTPEDDADEVERIVEETHGLFSKLSNILSMSKLAKLRKALFHELAFRTATSDKGLIAWDGEDDLAIGNELFIEDEEGNRTTAPDDIYTLTDGTAVTVAEGKVAEIIAPEAAAPVEEPAEAPAEPEIEIEAAEDDEAPAEEVPAPDADTEETAPDAIEELRKEMNEAYARIDALDDIVAELRERLEKVEAQPAAVEAHKAVKNFAATGDRRKENLARILAARNGKN